MKSLSRVIILSLFLAVFSAPLGCLATMESRSYVIFDNINQKFDGPIISAVALGVVTDTKASLSWTTDFPSDSFVQYDTDGGFSGRKEQGQDGATRLSHNVQLTGLLPSTAYYYRVKSTRANGGTSLGTIGSFTTSAATTQPIPTTPPNTGGGVLIIDKTDKKTPVITDFNISDIADVSAAVTWTTDEPATSFAEYGITPALGRIFGAWDTTQQHRVVIDKLEPEKTYYVRALSSDAWGNVGTSTMTQFTTLSTAAAEEHGQEPGTEKPKEPDAQSLEQASQRVIELMNKLQNQVSLNVIQSTLFNQYSAIERLANIIPAPILSGEPRVEAEADKAEVYWTTDKNSNSLVSIAEENAYDAKKSDPYQQTVGNASAYTQIHKVEIFNLKPNTVYHFRLSSKAAIGPTGMTRDYSFKTKLAALEITSLFAEVVDPNTADIKWVTSKEADSEVVYAPYRNNVLSVDESKTMKDGLMTAIHQLRVADFESGVVYDVQVISKDKDGNIAQDRIAMFSTGQDETPPEISFIKTDSTIYSDKSARTQTIISWKTNEQATGRISYQEGVLDNNIDLAEQSELEPSYSRDHLFVITKFKPGTVYSFKVVSADSSGNSATSTVHTFMTPKQKDSIIQIIIRILEETFGWTRRLM